MLPFFSSEVSFSPSLLDIFQTLSNIFQKFVLHVKNWVVIPTGNEHCRSMRVFDDTRKYQLFYAARDLVQGQLTCPAEKALKQEVSLKGVLLPQSQLCTPLRVCIGARGTTRTPTRAGPSWRPRLQGRHRLCKKNTRAASRFF
jgi:hypothetical protein